MPNLKKMNKKSPLIIELTHLNYSALADKVSEIEDGIQMNGQLKNQVKRNKERGEEVQKRERWASAKKCI